MRDLLVDFVSKMSSTWCLCGNET